MPIHEFHCEACGRAVEVFFRSASRVVDDPPCPECGERRLRRRVSRFARLRTASDVAAEYGTPGIDAPADAYRDPRQIGQWVERRFAEYGMDVPDDTRDLIDAAREGDLPDAIDGI